MPKNKVNNNIKLKSGGGIINDATDGLSVDTGTTANKLVRLDGDAKLPAVDGSQLTNIIKSRASSTLQMSADTIRDAMNTSYDKVKEIRVGHSGTITVKFDLLGGAAATAYGRVYINGNAVGIEHTAGSSWKYVSEDFTVNKLDLVQLYCKMSGGSGRWEAKNFRIYYTLYDTLDVLNLD